ncbi:MAG: hypothetical protein QNJ63_12010 [Calothrix sp. MO_192.B10]|nr:hypothetical protein [Calothrix sp. MO_192.B10]
MKKDLKVRLSLRITPKRKEKLEQYATENDKTITQVIEELIDTLSVQGKE